MSEEASLATPTASSPLALEPIAFPIQDSVLELKLLLSAFIAVSKEDKQRYKDDIEELRSAVTLLNNRETPEKSADSSITDRTGVNRRSSMFFGSPNAHNYRTDSKTQIQILQNDVVYEKELKISSLEGLQYLSKQMQILGSKYPSRDVKMWTVLEQNVSHGFLLSTASCNTSLKFVLLQGINYNWDRTN